MPSQNLDAALRKIDQLNTRMKAFEKQDFDVTISDSTLRKIAEQALDSIKMDIKKMVISNFTSSDYAKSPPSKDYRHTDKLRDAVLNCTIEGDFRKNKAWKILVLYPRNLSPYTKKSPLTGKTHTSKFYTVAASLNYGAVLPPPGKRFSTTAYAKKKAKLTAATNRMMFPGLFNGTQEVVAKANKKDADPTFMKVIPPKKFFYLNDAQRGLVMQMFTREFNNLLNIMMGKPQDRKA